MLDPARLIKLDISPVTEKTNVHDVVKKAVLIIACGAIARELAQVVTANEWRHVEVAYLPALLHNVPGKLPDAIRREIEARRGRFDVIFVAYADCGTGGRLDSLLATYGIERLPGAHCYEVFAGQSLFASLSQREPGTFYLTDFLVRNFDRLIHRGLGLDRHPELRDAYFGNYRRLIYLAQSDDPALAHQAASYAARLGLTYERHYTGLGTLRTHLASAV